MATAILFATLTLPAAASRAATQLPPVGTVWESEVVATDPPIGGLGAHLEGHLRIERTSETTFQLESILRYEIHFDTCMDVARRFSDMQGELSSDGTRIDLRGTAGLVTESTTCAHDPMEHVGDGAESVQIDGDTLSGFCCGGIPFEMAPSSSAASGEEEYGIVVRDDGVIEINSPPGEVLSITRADLPPDVGARLAVIGAMVVLVGPPSSISTGDPTVLLDGVPVARLGDSTAKGGSIVEGDDSVLVNGVPAGVLGAMTVTPFVNAGGVPAVGGPIASTGPAMTDPGAFWIERQIEQALDAGATTVEGDFPDFEVGDGVVIGDDPVDIGIIERKGSIVLDEPLRHDHPIGTRIARIHPELIRQARLPEDQRQVPSSEQLYGTSLSAPPDTIEVPATADGSPAAGPPLVLLGVAAAALAAGSGVGLALVRRRRADGP